MSEFILKLSLNQSIGHRQNQPLKNVKGIMDETKLN